jgi:hypothetical protein
MADDTTLAIVAIVGIVAVAGLLAFAMLRTGGGTGPVTVVDSAGNLLYTVSDRARVVGSVPFEPA